MVWTIDLGARSLDMSMGWSCELELGRGIAVIWNGNATVPGLQERSVFLQRLERSLALDLLIS